MNQQRKGLVPEGLSRLASRASTGLMLVASIVLIGACGGNRYLDAYDDDDNVGRVSAGCGDQVRRLHHSTEDGDRLTDVGRTIEEGLERYPADFYLIDLSGSMGQDVEVIRAHDFPEGAEVWAFNAGMLFKLFEPSISYSSGDTPLWQCLDRLIDHYLQDPDGKELTVMTDGVDNDFNNASATQTMVDGIIKDAKGKNLVINMVAAGDYTYAPQGVVDTMMKIPNETGGGHFIRGFEEDDKDKRESI